MKKIFTAALLLLTLAASAANAYGLRSPQVNFNTAPLLSDFNALGETGINPATMQTDVEVWSTNILGNSDFTIAFKNGNGDEVGVYNGSDTSHLFPVFPAAASAGWYAAVHFSGTNLTVNYFDGISPTAQGTVTYAGVNKSLFGFYIKGPGGTYYSQDVFNLSGPQILTYVGVANPGDWWLCFQDSLANPGSSYNSVVLAIESVKPTPTRSSTWGDLKSKYR